MTDTTPSVPRWQEVAERLESLAAAPTAQQVATAAALSIPLGADVPAPVAAVVIRHGLGASLLENMKEDAEIPEALGKLEEELSVPTTSALLTGTRAEVSALFEARYMLLTARGLRSSQPSVGDVVESAGWQTGERRVISSIGANGRVYMKRLPARAAWPNHLTTVARVGAAGHAEAVSAVDAAVRNATVSTSTSFENYRALSEFELTSHIPSAEAIRQLEELLESGEQREEPFQRLITRHPALLAATVMGGWKTYVIPKPRLGSEYVPDFLVLGLNSIGPQWVTVEIEGARHPVVLQNGELPEQTRHAIKQIEDWRDWLTSNVAYVQAEKGLHGLTNRAPGLVVIGRRDPAPTRQSSRARVGEQARIEVHSWDWILRSAQNLAANALRVSDFAVDNVRAQTGVAELTMLDIDIDEDDEAFLFGEPEQLG